MTVLSAGLRVLVALPLLLIQIIWMMSHVSPAAKAAPVVLFIMALWRAPVALVILGVLAPLAGMLGLWTALPFQGPRLFEQLAIAVVLAVLMRSVSWASSRIAVPGLVFAVIALTSAITTMPAWLMMHGIEPTLATVWAALLQGDIFAITSAWQPAHAAMLISLGVLLALATESSVRKESENARWVILGLAAGGTVAALLNLRRVVELAAGRDALSVAGVADLLASVRLNTQFDINAAGSLFAMLVLACASGLSRAGWYRWMCAGAMATMAVGGLWLSGSRTALAAALVVTVAAMAVLALRARPEHRRRAALALGGVMLVGAAAVAAYPATRNFAVSSSIDSRLILYRTAVRMWRDTPVTGAGVGTFFTRSADYGSAEVDKILVRGQVRENAHNYFLQVLAELGVLGFALYAALLATVIWTATPRAIWLGAAVLVFLGTSLTGHPQLLANAALPFWTVFGCLAATATPPSQRSFRAQAWMAGVIGLCLVLTVPFRTGRVRDAIPLEHGGLGVSLWHTSEEGYRYRTGDDLSSVFVPTGHTMMLPVRLGPGTASSATVDIRVDGVVVNRLVLQTGGWTQLHLSIRNARRRFVELRLVGPPGLTFLIGKVDAKRLE